ncbi:hypothetical protein QQ045_006541 [Rhodiola kirilowii]
MEDLHSLLSIIRFRLRSHAFLRVLLVSPNIAASFIMIISIILISFILGGSMTADSRQQESFSDIIRFPLFSYENQFLKGVYFTKLRLGNPPQELNVIVDTGSDPSWVNCRSNEMIGMRTYDMEQSVTASLFTCPHRKKPCPFHIDYYDKSSVFGFHVTDALHYGTLLRNASANLSSNIVFGCINHRDGFNRREVVEGILGLGQGGISVIAQLSSQHVAPQIFSHCLASRGDGFLILGQISDKALVYTPVVSESKYQVIIESIAVNTETVAIDPRVFQTEHGVTFDSGAQISVLIAEAYDSLVNAVSNFLNQTPYVSLSGLHCYLISASQAYPTLHFKFSGGASLSLTPAYYLVENIFDAQGGWCIAFRRVSDVTILGAPVLSDKIIVYDLSHRRIGWVEHDCSESAVNVSLTYDVGNQATSYSAGKICIIITVMFVIFTM